jgi:hypothetical protein
MEVVNFFPKSWNSKRLGQSPCGLAFFLALPPEPKSNNPNGLRREEPGESVRFLDFLARSLTFSSGYVTRPQVPHLPHYGRTEGVSPPEKLSHSHF